MVRSGDLAVEEKHVVCALDGDVGVFYVQPEGPAPELAQAEELLWQVVARAREGKLAAPAAVHEHGAVW